MHEGGKQESALRNNACKGGFCGSHLGVLELGRPFRDGPNYGKGLSVSTPALASWVSAAKGNSYWDSGRSPDKATFPAAMENEGLSPEREI